ncbi:MAG: hypothetical protein A3H23_01930 [Planctomycetes bacterium RIFCSPLOWO2_12_FULL_40_19]|nr:MAG: hypothetical protein A3H23_01930 [Planctomycetes bacterium RIFCSPLOWO2_12_FULL_40_19]
MCAEVCPPQPDKVVLAGARFFGWGNLRYMHNKSKGGGASPNDAARPALPFASPTRPNGFIQAGNHSGGDGSGQAIKFEVLKIRSGSGVKNKKLF